MTSPAVLTLSPNADEAAAGQQNGPAEQPLPIKPRARKSPAAASRFSFIDALRGLAALGVAAYHIFRFPPLGHQALGHTVDRLIPGPIRTVVDHGWMGVQIFFVISGFVIAYALRDLRMTRGNYRTFIAQRSLRLGPPYWFTMLLVVALGALSASLLTVDYPLIGDKLAAADPTWGQIGAHFIYLQNLLGFHNLSAGFWTLCIEMQFYLLFAALIGGAEWLSRTVMSRAARRRSAAANSTDANAPAAGWALALAIVPLGLVSLFRFSLNTENTDWVFHFFAYFTLGALAWWTLSGRIAKFVFWAFVGAVLIRQRMHWTLDASAAVIAAVTIYGVGRLGHLDDWLSAGWLQRLGRMSYSLYLVHYPVSWVITTMGYELTGDAALPALGWLLLSLVASLGAAELMYAAVEMPAIRLAKRYKEIASEGRFSAEAWGSLARAWINRPARKPLGGSSVEPATAG